MCHQLSDHLLSIANVLIYAVSKIVGAYFIRPFSEGDFSQKVCHMDLCSVQFLIKLILMYLCLCICIEADTRTHMHTPGVIGMCEF